MSLLILNFEKKFKTMTFSSSVFFKFESDFVDSLRCIPMIVRFKLDTCGIKLKLDQWNHFTEGDRQQLVQLPCETTEEIAAYRATVSHLVFQYTQATASELPVEEHPPWLDQDNIAEIVKEKANAVAAEISLTEWKTLEPIQRFALIKLSRSSHENRNFLPALQEFLG
jgi:hypothetical protein